MPKLKAVYESEAEIPEGYNELYQERGGRFELTGIEGVKTQADIDRMNTALVKERADHKVSRDELLNVKTALGDVDPTTIPATLEELEEARARLATLTAEGKLDESKIQDQITAAVTRAVGPVKRDLDAAQRQVTAEQKKLAEKDAENTKLQDGIKRDRMRSAIRDAAIAAKVIPAALDDAVLVGETMFELTTEGKLVTKNDAGVTPGLDPKEWTKDMMEKRPHWWPASQGGGAGGGRGGNLVGKDNPWSREGWNVTAQGQKVRELGAEKAAELANRVGAKLGDTKAPKAA